MGSKMGELKQKSGNPLGKIIHLKKLRILPLGLVQD